MNGIKPLARCMAVAFGGSMVLLSGSVYAQQATDQPATQKQERIEVTGSNIKQIDSSTSAPVTIITREQIEKSGATSVEQLLKSISVATSAGGTVTANASGATTGGLSSVSLRGLQSTRTLVLVNGKRIAPYGVPTDSASIDVDSIPISAVERVEVLKDGASAIYGSDAIAGVVNFILRKDYQGAQVDAEYGQAYDGKAQTKKINAIAGFGDLGKDRYNFTISAGYQKEDPLYGRDRSFSASGINVPEKNISFSSNAFPANFRFPTGTVGPGGALNGTYNPLLPNCAPSAYVPQIASVATRCVFDFAPFVALTPDIERKNVMGSGRLLISDALELYAEASWSQKASNTIIQPVPIPGIKLQSTSPFYPTAFVQSLTGGPTPTLTVGYRDFASGNRDLTDTATANRLNLGAKGTLVGWDYDTGLLYATNEVTEKLNGGYPRLVTDATGPGALTILGSGNVDLFGNGTPPAVLAQVKAANFNAQAFKTNTSLASFNGKASREFGELAGGAMGFAVGFDIRQDGFKIDPNAELSTGNVSGYGGNFLKADLKRKAYALFTELNAPVTKAIEVDGALRYDVYDGVNNPNNFANTLTALTDPNAFSDINGNGMTAAQATPIAQNSVQNSSRASKLTGKLGFRWQPSKELLVRGTVGTGFRIPSLSEQFGPIVSGLTGSINDPIRCAAGANGGSDCAVQYSAYFGGNASLKPEESRSATLGFILEPNRDVSFGATYFFTRVTNLISALDPQYILNTPAEAAHVIRGPVDIAGLPGPVIAIDQSLTNIGKVFVSGIDLDGKLRLPSTEVGQFTVGYSGTYMQRWDAQNTDGSYSSSLDVASAGASGVIPRLKHVISLDWLRGPWGATVTYNWQGSYTDICGNNDGGCATNGGPNPPRKVGAYETWDLQGTYSGLKNLQLKLGAKNLFNRQPPYTNIGGAAVFQAGYDPSYTDPRGRFVYVSGSYKFW